MSKYQLHVFLLSVWQTNLSTSSVFFPCFQNLRCELIWPKSQMLSHMNFALSVQFCLVWSSSGWSHSSRSYDTSLWLPHNLSCISNVSFSSVARFKLSASVVEHFTSFSLFLLPDTLRTIVSTFWQSIQMSGRICSDLDGKDGWSKLEQRICLFLF